MHQIYSKGKQLLKKKLVYLFKNLAKLFIPRFETLLYNQQSLAVETPSVLSILDVPVVHTEMMKTNPTRFSTFEMLNLKISDWSSTDELCM